MLQLMERVFCYLPLDPSQNTKKEPSLLRVTPLGNWRLRRRTVVFFWIGSYFKTLPLSSAEKTKCMKFLKIKKIDNCKLIYYCIY